MPRWQCGTCGAYVVGRDLSATCSGCGERGDGSVDELLRLELKLRKEASDLDSKDFPDCCDVREISVRRGVANQLRDLRHDQEESIPTDRILQLIEEAEKGRDASIKAGALVRAEERDFWATRMRQALEGRQPVYMSAAKVEKEILIWWLRRHGRGPFRRDYVRKVIRSNVDRLRYLRTKESEGCRSE